MKNIIKYLFFLVILLLCYGCSPKYTANFDYTSHKHNETNQKMVEEIIFSKKIKNEYKADPIIEEQLIASNSDLPVLLDNPTQKIVENYQKNIEAIKTSGLEDKQLNKALKKETRHFKKQVRKELREKKSNDFGRYLLIALAVIVVLLLVLIVYAVSKSPH